MKKKKMCSKESLSLYTPNLSVELYCIASYIISNKNIVIYVAIVMSNINYQFYTLHLVKCFLKK